MNMSLPRSHAKRFQPVFLIYWVLVAYVFAALVWWFIALTRQNTEMTEMKLRQSDSKTDTIQGIREFEKRKFNQYVGEGIAFLLLIVGGAWFVYRAVRREINAGKQRQHLMMAITHELKTPLAVTQINLETLQKRTLDEEQRHRLIRNSLHEASRLNNLCNNLLLSFQLDAGGYVPSAEQLDFSQLVTNVIGDFSMRFPSRSIEADLAPSILLTGDVLLLQLAVSNLLDNAIKYSPKKSTVNVNLHASPSVCTLEVADEGTGIADREKKLVFRKYYRSADAATRHAGGTGIGLYLTRKIAHHHRAKIRAADNPRGGCRMVLEFNLTA
jgi:two-component system sensor histidine kinase CiaH